MAERKKKPNLSDDSVRLFAEMTSEELMLLFNSNGQSDYTFYQTMPKRYIRLKEKTNVVTGIG